MGKRTTRGRVPDGPSYPRKRLYRARAHGNPLNDAVFPVPTTPDDIDWSSLFPETPDRSPVRFLDVGCGYGGLAVKLASVFPQICTLGMELRDSIAEFVKQRIEFLREESPGAYRNVACVRANAMKHLPNYFCRGQLERMFFLFPDPHFKAANHRRRIINTHLLTVYAHFLKPDGRLYTTTDVEELAKWMKEKLDAHPLFQALTAEEIEADPVAALLPDTSEEGRKVARNRGQVFKAIYRRLPDDVVDDSPCQISDSKETTCDMTSR